MSRFNKVLGVVLVLSLCLASCRGIDTSVNAPKATDVKSEDNSRLNEYLKTNSSYRVLDTNEYFYSTFSRVLVLDSYNYKPEEKCILRIIVKDLSTGSRVYIALEDDLDEVSDVYKKFACLMKGDKFEYLGNDDYKLVGL